MTKIVQKLTFGMCFLALWVPNGILVAQQFVLDTTLNYHKALGANRVEQWLGLPGEVHGLSGDDNGNLVLWEWPSLKQVQLLKEHKAGLNALVIAPGGASIYTADESGRIREFRYPGMILLSAFVASFDIVCYVTYNPKDGSLLVAGYNSDLRETADGLVRIGDPERMRGIQQLAASLIYPTGYSYGITDAWLDHKRQELWYADGFQIFVISLPEGHQVRSYRCPAVVNNLLVADGSLYAWAAGQVFRWDLNEAEGMPKASRMLFPAEMGYCRLFKAPHKPWLLTGDVRGSIYVLDEKNLEQLHRWEGHAGAIRSLWMPSDGSKLVSTGLDGLIRVWSWQEALLVQEDAHETKESSSAVEDRLPRRLPEGLVVSKPWPALNLPTGKYAINIRDAQQEDGDSLSVYLNDTLWISAMAVTSKGLSFDLHLGPGKTTLQFMALNEGAVPPNTAVILITGPGGFRSRQVLKSRKGECVSWEWQVN